MRKIIFVLLSTYFAFLCEFGVFNYIHPLLKPDFVLLVVIFANLAFGVRFSLLSAVWGGVIKDSFATDMFGLFVFSYVTCAYVTSLLIKYVYQRGSKPSRLLLVVLVSLFQVILNFVLHAMLDSVDIRGTFQYILLPDVIMTLIVANVTFQLLRKCALRLFVYL